jgi:hypothetical protein
MLELVATNCSTESRIAQGKSSHSNFSIAAGGRFADV